ncbi:GNAT family N-acetyltransferase [Promicromonospora iranensis]|uniref:GNAT superfamily N-acetyltransferase n=1 Tax=Promicromonospora iranensis TaxID=1105144 RepID=A0ABU2CW36_9MICO|nr:GNAT family N-acetyltransferase [Promicromonospora iranensis]MDR7385569.1 GNAT superfamily N-acetyltransferase [Promicromonospora iranensis]
MVSRLARAWVAGWAVSRGTEPPVELLEGFRVDVGLPHHVARYVLLDADEATVRRVAGSVTVPSTWLKAFVEPEVVASWLPPGWTEGPLTFLMATDLRSSATRTPDGYAVRTETEGAVTFLRVLADDGVLAARGQVVVTGECAVVDQVETEPAHRRRGLGSLVMRRLANIAAERGAATAVLGASVEGRALYESLGWRVQAPLAGFVYRRESSAGG